MNELISARVPLSVPVTECYTAFSRPVDFRKLPGLAIDCFAYVQASTMYRPLAERFIATTVDHGTHYYLPQNGRITIGTQVKGSNITWGANKIPDLGVVGCDTMGIGHGGGFVTFTVADFHSVISHMIYFNIAFDEYDLFGQKCLCIDLGGPLYAPTNGLYKAFVLTEGLREYAMSNFKRL